MPEKEPILTQEERIQRLMRLTNFSRLNAELHINMTNGKIKNPHLVREENIAPEQQAEA